MAHFGGHSHEVIRSDHRTMFLPKGYVPLNFQKAKEEFERQYIDDLLRFSSGNVKLAAEIAGRDRKGLYVIMEKHGIKPSDYRDSNSL